MTRSIDGEGNLSAGFQGNKAEDKVKGAKAAVKKAAVRSTSGKTIFGIHYAWIVCTACALAIFGNSGITDSMFSVYQPFIMDKYGVTNTQMSLILTVKSITALVSAVVSVKYYRFFSIRTGMLLASLLCFASFFLFGFADAFGEFFMCGVLLGFGNGLGTNIPVCMALANWFEKRRKVAMSITVLAGSVSLMGIPSVFTGIIENVSLRAGFNVNAACVLAVTILSFLLMRNAPSDMGCEPYGAGEAEAEGKAKAAEAAGNSGSSASAKAAADDTGNAGAAATGNAGRQTAEGAAGSSAAAVSERGSLEHGDWIIFSAIYIAVGIICMTSYSYFSLFLSHEGVSSHTIAVLLTVTGVSVAIGKFAYGWLSEKFSSYVCNRLYFAALFLGIGAMALFPQNTAILFISVAVMGFGSPIGSVGAVSWVWDLTSHEQNDRAVQLMQICLYIGMVGFNFLPGVIADLIGGSYKPVYIGYALLSLPTFFVIQYLYRKSFKKRA